MASPMHCNLLYFLIFFSCLNTTSFASDHISLNNSLSGSLTIISQGGIFELGFVQIGNKTFSPRYYLCIWYKKVPQITPVWIANRNVPISDPNTSELKISTDGNLVLLDRNKAKFWSTNLTTLVSNSTICKLLDTGNLVLEYSSTSTTNVLWQSMDYPTDTWLPGGKLGQSKVLGRQKLISWKNSDDPAEGIFSLEIDPNGTSQYFIFWNQSKPFWSSGEWNGQFFGNVPEMNAISDNMKGKHLFKYVSNENETYFTYPSRTDLLTSRFVMDTYGQIKQITWFESLQEWMLLWFQPQAQCNVYAFCGPFGICDPNSLPSCSCIRGFDKGGSTELQLGDFKGGCTRNSPLQCNAVTGSMHSIQTDKFFQMSNIELPDNSHSLHTNSIEDCEQACLQNCSCNAYAYNESCSIWYGDLLNLYQESDGSSKESLFVRLSATEFKNTNQKKTWILWASTISAVGSLACGIVIFLLVRRYQKRMLVSSMNVSESGLVAFRYGDVRRMTNNFSESLGRGGFGSVFKGALPNSCAIAVKKLERIVEVGEKQFRSEIRTIGIIKHVNLVRLRGFCSERNKRLLIYDYMPNGSLDKQLFRSSSHLNWCTQYQIALGTARGLAYLHESCVDCIIHCDVKPENILLDELFIPKIADFGMAKLVGRDFSRVITTLRGTIGYLAPEWISGMAITSKIDVYSYGLVLMELLSGRRNSEKLEGKNVGYFPLLAAIELKEGNVHTLLDPNLNGDANLGEVERVCRVACWCIQDEEHNRPGMGQVVQLLEGSLEVSMPPIPRSLVALAEHSGSFDFSEEQYLAQSYPMESIASMIPQDPE